MISRMKQPRTAAAWTIAALAAALGACSTTGTKGANTAEVVYLGPNDRVPASAPSLPVWTPDSITFGVNASGGRQSGNLDMKYVQSWTEMVAAPADQVCTDSTLVPKDTTCPSYHFNTGTGKSPAWDAFFSAKKADKAGVLAAAIDGVGKVSAQALVDNGYFSRKPRSWDDFVDELQRAANAGVIKKNVVTVVLENRTTNAAKMGYDVTSATIVEVPCVRMLPVGQVACPPVPQVQSQVISHDLRVVTIDVINPQLQSFETETLTVSGDHDSAGVQVSHGTYTVYNIQQQVNGRSVHITATGMDRIPADLPHDVGSAKLFREKGTNQIKLWAQVNPRYIGQGSDPLVFRYRQLTCQKKFLGICGDYTPGAWQTQVITGTDTTQVIRIGDKQKTKFEYSFARPTGRWYNSKELEIMSTDTVGQ